METEHEAEEELENIIRSGEDGAVYEVLGVNASVTFDRIEEVYEQLALKYDPKKSKFRRAPEAMVFINAAFEHLREIHRREYNEATTILRSYKTILRRYKDPKLNGKLSAKVFIRYSTATFPKRDPKVTKRLIKTKFRSNAGADVATEAIKVSLKCPLGKKRIKTPCRPNKCVHIECFDLETYLAMHQSIPKRPSKMSKCPICHSKIVLNDLSVDMYFAEILNSNEAQGVENIEMNSDGSWHLGTNQSNDNQSVIQVED